MASVKGFKAEMNNSKDNLDKCPIAEKMVQTTNVKSSHI